MPLEVRPCTPSALESLRLAWPSSGVHDAHYRRQVSGDATYLIAWIGEEPVGSCMVQWAGPVGVTARRLCPEAAEMNHLQVRPEFRNQGAGRALIRAAEDIVVRAGPQHIALSVADDNDDGQRLYTRLGYAPTGVHDVTEYDWVDRGGEVRHEAERNELLVKRADRS